MKRLNFSNAAWMVICILIVAVAMSYAGSVYDRVIKTLPTTTGNATWTNDIKYGAVILKKITYYSSLDAGATLTVRRVTSDSTYTQTVCSIVGAGAGSNATTFTTSYLKYGDLLTLAPSTLTGGVVMVEYEQQEH